MKFILGEDAEITLDDERLELRRGGELVALEPRVLELLVFLVHHRDRVGSHDELMREVWRDRDVGTSTLTRAISLLRTALGDRASIQTVYGRGYRFAMNVSIPLGQKRDPAGLASTSRRTAPKDDSEPEGTGGGGASARELLQKGSELALQAKPREARAAFIRAAGLARQSGAGDVIARAALGFRWVTPLTLERNRATVDLLEEALAANRSASTGRRLILEGELVEARFHERPTEESVSSIRALLSRARSLRSDDAIVANLIVMAVVDQGPGKCDESLQLLSEASERAEALGDLEQLARAQYRRLSPLLAKGDLDEYSRQLQKVDALASQRGDEAMRLFAAAMRAMFDAIRGESKPAATMASEVIKVADPELTPMALAILMPTWRLHVSQQAAPLAEVGEASMLEAVEDADNYPYLRAMVAWLLSDVGLAEAAKPHLEVLEADDFAIVPRDPAFLTTLVMLSDVAIAIVDRARASRIYEKLRSWKQYHASAFGGAYMGPIALTLARLANLLRDYESAARHARASLGWAERQRSPAVEARSCLELARALARDRASAAGEGEPREFADRALRLAERQGLGDVAQAVSEFLDAP